MAPVTGAALTLTENLYGAVDGAGRVAIVYPSVARTATPTASTLYTRCAKGVTATIVVTAKTGTPSITMAVQYYDPGSTTWVSLLTSVAITAAGTTTLVVAPGVAAAANLAVSTTIPDMIRVLVTHADAQSITYSVGLDWML
jgi:hypothetical protein